jgi:hypothetical protein
MQRDQGAISFTALQGARRPIAAIEESFHHELHLTDAIRASKKWATWTRIILGQTNR